MEEADFVQLSRAIVAFQETGLYEQSLKLMKQKETALKFNIIHDPKDHIIVRVYNLVFLTNEQEIN